MKNIESLYRRNALGFTFHSPPTQVRGYATETATEKEDKDSEIDTRLNPIGVQQLSLKVHSQVFFDRSTPPPDELVELSISHLTRHGLYGKNTGSNPPIEFDIPPLRGDSKTLDEHFYILGMDAAEPYLSYAKEFANIDLPQRPSPESWVRRSGWTFYGGNKPPVEVNFPEDNKLVFDVEVLYKESPFAVMACAAGPSGWWVWISPWIIDASEKDRNLVPLGKPDQPRIIIGHNIGYDRARIMEEYSLEKSKFAFLDTMSLHVATNGMCSRQRPTWLKHQKLQKLKEEVAADSDSVSQETLQMLESEEEEAWISRSSINSLQEVARFHCDIKVDKGVRDQFGILDRAGVLENLDRLLDYCVADVETTHKVYKKVLPNFLEVCPHPVSFAALRHLSSVTLPVDKTWEDYIRNAEETYIKTSEAIKKSLVELAANALVFKDDPETWIEDPWLRQLDWTKSEVRMVKAKKNEAADQPAKNQKMPGEPKWYRDLFTSKSADMKISVRSRIAPILLKLSWDGKPLVWSDVYGWVVKAPLIEESDYKDKPLTRCDMGTEKNESLKNDNNHIYYKLPHKDGPTARCVSPLAKSYLKYFEDGTLSSEYPLAKEALEMNAQCSYWISARERIRGQMVIYESDLDPGLLKDGFSQAQKGSESSDKGKDFGKEGSGTELGIILPQIIPMGTVTRRAVERTWLTASNAKKNRLGSELKAMVKAPPGYVFVGSDVDSQELWIASLVGDSQFKLHGGNAIGFMTLEGTKSAGTDLHSKTASILGISRNHAKIFNYGRIYGAGVKFASTLLKQFNPALPDTEADKTSEQLYKETKGKKTINKLIHGRPFWRGGTESFVFNKLEEFANQDLPRTPVLGAGITEALRREYLSVNVFMPSRINWAIQSSGVDYLHLLVISMEYLISRFKLGARLAITVHDEIRYLVKTEHQYQVALALQIANLWTRAMFSQQMGIDDLPQSCAYFSAVDIDRVLRKEVDMECITPSQPNAIPAGESINITDLLIKLRDMKFDGFGGGLPEGPPGSKEDYKYTRRTPVMEQLQGKPNLTFLKAQNADDEELQKISTELRKKSVSSYFRGARRNPLSDITWGEQFQPNSPVSWEKITHPSVSSKAVAKTYGETYEAVSTSVDGLRWEPPPTASERWNPPLTAGGRRDLPPTAGGQMYNNMRLKLDIQEAKRLVNEARKKPKLGK